MNPNPEPRVEYMALLDELAEALGFPGEVIRVWQEQDTDWVHFLVSDPGAPRGARGGRPTRVVNLAKKGTP